MITAKLFSAGIVGGALILIGPGTSQAFSQPNARPMIVRHDPGGYVLDYALKMKKMTRSGQDVSFAGRCDSACTMYLALPKGQSCISQSASFGFHLPYGSTPQINALFARYMMKTYPAWVRSWIKARGGLRSGVMRMDFRYASRFLPTCEKQQVQLVRSYDTSRVQSYDTTWR